VEQAGQFEKGATTLKRNMRCRNLKVCAGCLQAARV
jgi:hypothetical protein